MTVVWKSQRRHAWVALLFISVGISFIAVGQGTLVSALGAAVGQVAAAALMSLIGVAVLWLLTLLTRRAFPLYVWINSAAGLTLVITVAVVIGTRAHINSAPGNGSTLLVPALGSGALVSSRHSPTSGEGASLESFPPTISSSPTVPQQFIGFYSTDCARENDSDVRIDADEISFYESGGRIERVAKVDDSNFLAVFELSDGRRTWSKSSNFELMSDGSLAIDGYIRKRCAQYQYGPNPVVLQGTVVSIRSEAPDRDEYVYAALKLDGPVMVRGKGEELPFVRGIDVVQLVLRERHLSVYESFVGTRMVVVGELFPASTAWHKTDVLMNVSNVYRRPLRSAAP